MWGCDEQQQYQRRPIYFSIYKVFFFNFYFSSIIFHPSYIARSNQICLEDLSITNLYLQIKQVLLPSCLVLVPVGFIFGCLIKMMLAVLYGISFSGHVFTRQIIKLIIKMSNQPESLPFKSFFNHVSKQLDINSRFDLNCVHKCQLRNRKPVQFLSLSPHSFLLMWLTLVVLSDSSKTARQHQN